MEEVRLQKLQEIRESGVNPFPSKFERTHKLAEARDLVPDTEVKVAGRIMLFRSMGKLTFVHLQDETGKLQIALEKKSMNEEKYDFFQKKIDLGDFVGVEGKMFVTHKGEKTVLVNDFVLLTKTLRSMPEKWHGIKDQEIKYRKRYLDLMMNHPEVMERFKKRRDIIYAMREYLITKGYTEVETPILQPIYGGTMARPFETFFHALEQTMYMRISNELYLKRLIAGGYDRVFEFSVDFRNEGIDTSHNPEFLQMETMMAYGNFEDNMREVENMVAYIAEKVLGKTKIQFQGKEIDLTPPWEKISIVDAVKEITGEDFYAWKSDEEARVIAEKKGVRKIGPSTTKFGVLMELFELHCEHTFVHPTLIYGFPRENSPLAKVDPNNPDFTERFELIIHGREYANSYSELNDPLLLRENFELQHKMKEQGNQETHPIDEDFLEAMEYGMPPTSGLGIGVDRLIMLLTDTHSIRDIMFFPALRNLSSSSDKE